MNKYLFYTIKALDKNLNSDVIQVIWKNIKKDTALFIQESILKRYLHKIAKNCMIFLHLCNIVQGYDPISLNIERFIFHANNNVCYSYIQDPALWLRYIILLKNFNNIRPLYTTILNDIYMKIILIS